VGVISLGVIARRFSMTLLIMQMFAVISRNATGNIPLVNIIVTANCNLDLPTLQTLAAATNIFNFPATPGVLESGRKIQGEAGEKLEGVCAWLRSSAASIVNKINNNHYI